MGDAEPEQGARGPGTGGDERPLAFATLVATGTDAAVHHLVRLRATLLLSGGEAREFDRALDPALDGAQARAVWGEFEAFLGDAALVVGDLATYREWQRHLGAAQDRGRALTALGELAALFLPGRLSARGAALLGDLLPSPPCAGQDPSPLDLRRATAELVARVLGLEPLALAIAGGGYRAAWERLSLTEPAAARSLDLALSLLERPSRWSPIPAAERGALADGRFDAALDACGSLAEALEALEPRWTAEYARWADQAPMPVDREHALPFEAEDLARLDAALLRHVPELFAEENGLDAPPAPRTSQHAVAREVAAALGRAGATAGGGELLLVHAPTGTGKTLAYLVPALLWARRHGVRVGIATYTRALQEQAMDREVPRALGALRRAGVEPGFRVSVLKGRDNYLCWRSLKLHVPGEEAGAEELLAWTNLALFALADGEGDLDRLPRRPPLALESSRAWHESAGELARQVRAEGSCCSRGEDRRTCAAEVARRRAERSHVVLTNHSFALARREFFRHVVFDECEHLHDQAHAAWSHALRLRTFEGLLARLARPGSERSRAVLDRLERTVLEGSPTHASVGAAQDAVALLDGTLLELTGEVERFLRWRAEALRARNARDGHSLLREYVEDGAGAPLVDTRLLAARRGRELEVALAELSERLAEWKLPRLGRLRRSLDGLRAELVEDLEALEAWIPLAEGRPAFGRRTFHDVEQDARGGWALVARVLLPNEFLGRYYLPELTTGVFLSATTWMAGGFAAAQGYLGLDRAAEPALDEEREPRAVRTYRAPEVFDYTRVLVAVPRDAPDPGRDKEAALEYVRRFVAQLAERTGGRMLVLFTNAEDVRRTGEALEGFFRARRIPLWYQNMPGLRKEELGELFRRQVDSVLLGVDTFWYGADFPGETLEHLVIVRLPYGVPDPYHHAQCAVLGNVEQRRRIYMPRALAKFRQGFGRLMRRTSDRGCIYILDPRVLDPRHRAFLRELPVELGLVDERTEDAGRRARLVRGDTERVVTEALAHVGLDARSFSAGVRRGAEPPPERGAEPRAPEHLPILEGERDG